MREPQKSIELCRGDSTWDVVVDDVVVTSASDLQWAAFHALILAELYEWPYVELGEGVPVDAIEEGLRAHAGWDATSPELGSEVRLRAARPLDAPPEGALQPPRVVSR